MQLSRFSFPPTAGGSDFGNAVLIQRVVYGMHLFGDSPHRRRVIVGGRSVRFPVSVDVPPAVSAVARRAGSAWLSRLPDYTIVSNALRVKCSRFYVDNVLY